MRNSVSAMIRNAGPETNAETRNLGARSAEFHSGRPPESGPKYVATSYLSCRDPDDDLRFAYPLR